VRQRLEIGDDMTVQDAAPSSVEPDVRTRLIAAVDTYLLLCEQRQLDAAREYLADGAVMTFPGDLQYTVLEDMVADANRLYRWVRKHRDHFDCFCDEAGDVVVVSRGTLDGESLSGREFTGVRYQDRFVFRNDKIVDQQVWNDLAASGVLDPYPHVVARAGR
jgi:hypothetical protein